MLTVAVAVGLFFFLMLLVICPMVVSGRISEEERKYEKEQELAHNIWKQVFPEGSVNLPA